MVPDKILENTPIQQKEYPQVPNYLAIDYSKRSPADRKQLSYRSIARSKLTNEVIYDVNINRDSRMRRIVKVPPKLKNDTAIIFIGCSLTFGEGVEDYETFVSRISEKFPGANVYNLGQTGSSINQIYYDMHNDQFETYFPFREKNIILIYSFFQDHLLRQTCSFSCYGQNSWMRSKPWYEISKENTIEFKGFLRDKYPIYPFVKEIAGSSFFTYYSPELAKIDNDENLDLTAALLGEIVDKYKVGRNNLEAFVFFNPNSSRKAIEGLTARFLKKGITPIISNRNTKFMKHPKRLIPGDGHPAPYGHAIMANSIEWVLKKKHPELAEELK